MYVRLFPIVQLWSPFQRDRNNYFFLKEGKIPVSKLLQKISHTAQQETTSLYICK